jgi:hypothetical protein
MNLESQEIIYSLKHLQTVERIRIKEKKKNESEKEVT